MYVEYLEYSVQCFDSSFAAAGIAILFGTELYFATSIPQLSTNRRVDALKQQFAVRSW